MLRVTNKSNYYVRANVDKQPRNGRRADVVQPKSGTTRPREVQPRTGGRSVTDRRGGSRSSELHYTILEPSLI